MSTLFAQILPIFTNQTERVATEALRHILQQSEAARNALERMLFDAGVEVGSLARFQTEVSGEERERVDLVCSDENGTERVLIEAKFWAGFTDNQPHTYLARLPKEGHSVLLLVVPAQRMERLWPELCARAEASHTLTMISESGDVRSASVDSSERKMMVPSWHTVLERLALHANTDGDSVAVMDIAQLRGLTDDKEVNVTSALVEKELKAGYRGGVPNSLKRLVDDVIERAKGKPRIRNISRRLSSAGSYHRYFWLAGQYVWFGIHPMQWQYHRNTPLWLFAIPFRDEVRRALEPLNMKYAGSGGADYIHIPILLPQRVEYDAMLDDIITQLEHIGSLIDPDGPTYKKDSSDA